MKDMTAYYQEDEVPIELQYSEDNVFEFLEGCNEIEKQFGKALFELDIEDVIFNGGLSFSYEHINYECCSQMVDIKMEHKYRADFYISASLSAPDHGVDFIIEIDGHEYHEKTKEQATRDRIRERAFLKAGYRVIRFTGSEIYRDSKKCWIDVFEVIRASLKGSHE